MKIPRQRVEVEFSTAIGGDPVNHPPHYKSPDGLETIDVIESFGLDFNLGNAVKYILRAGKKGDAATDLDKAIWYLRRAMRRLGRDPSVRVVGGALIREAKPRR